MKNRLCLGTAQFGLDYGINNKTGKLPKGEVFEILDLARRSGIVSVDTAPVYGDSQRIIGDFISKTGAHFDVVSKLPSCKVDEVQYSCRATLNELHTDQLYGYLVHNFSAYVSSPEILDKMVDLREDASVQKIGFSLYSPNDLDYLLEKKIRFDLLQIPYNIVDRRFESYFSVLEDLGVEVHARSIYLQGLLFRNEHELTGNLVSFKPIILMLRELSNKLECGIDEIAVLFALSRQGICKIVVGVDSLGHFKRLLSLAESKRSYQEIESIAIQISSLNVQAELLIPSNWKA